MVIHFDALHRDTLPYRDLPFMVRSLAPFPWSFDRTRFACNLRVTHDHSQRAEMPPLS